MQHNYSNTNLNSAATVAQVASLTRREQRKLKTKLHRIQKREETTERRMMQAKEPSIAAFVYMILCRTFVIAQGQPLKAFLESGNKTIVLPSGNRVLAERMRKTQV